MSQFIMFSEFRIYSSYILPKYVRTITTSFILHRWYKNLSLLLLAFLCEIDAGIFSTQLSHT